MQELVAAHLFLAASVLHMLRILLTGAFRRPREVNYLIGIGLGLRRSANNVRKSQYVDVASLLLGHRAHPRPVPSSAANTSSSSRPGLVGPGAWNGRPNAYV